ncbi:protein PAXX isoform X3 [Equus quagga]|uniref:protein PAXX isoform X3 n=1 Tax=Equus quagga TaxID=89248 RepID=UPI001EE27605|nr:protein PAXX isoform X3 [Equus quagga]
MPLPPLCTLPLGPGPPRFVCYCEGEGSGAGFNLCVTDAAELWSTCFTPDSLAALKARFGLIAAEDIVPRFRAACKQQAVTFTLQEDRASLTLSGGPSALDFDLSKVPGPEAASRLQALTLGLAERVCSLERQLAGRVGGGHLAPSLGSPACASIPGFLPQLRRRQPPAQGRAPGWWGLSSSYQVKPVTYDGLGLSSFLWDSVSHEQASSSRERICLCGEGVMVLGSCQVQDPPPILFPPDPDPQRGGPGPGVRRRCPGESLINPGFKSKKPASGVDFDDP